MWRAACLVTIAACSAEPASMIDAPASTDDAAADASIPARLVAYVSGGPNIEWYSIDTSSVTLTRVGSIAAFAQSSSFLAIDPTTTHLYAVSESMNRVGAYSIDQATGALTFINDVSSGGNGPAHVSVDATGAFVFAANYGSGHIAVFPVQSNGGVGASQQTILAGMNAHQILTDPSNKFVFVPCLGVDYVAQYTFDATTGMLAANTPPTVATAAGAGPRHIAFSRTHPLAYVINERNSTLESLAFDTTTGRLTANTPLSTLPAPTPGNTTAEVVVDPSGGFVFGSNRGHNSIVTFTSDAAGALTLVGHAPTTGATPRSFAQDPTGDFVLVANQGGNSVVPFVVNRSTGTLSPAAGPTITTTTPKFVGIVALPN